MRHAGQMLFVLFVCAICLAGNASAQQSRSATNANVAGRVSPSAAAQRSPQRATQPEVSETHMTVALIGAVQKPGIYVAAQTGATIGNLLQSAGGLTTDSNGTIRVYVDGQAQKVEQVEQVLKAPLVDNQVIFVAPRGGASSRTLTLNNAPYRPVVITGLGIAPLVLNLGVNSQDVEGLVLMLGQPREVMGHNQFAAVCPQLQWLSPSDMLRPNTIVHFPPETVNNEGIRRAIDNGLMFERPMLIGVPAASIPVQQAPPPPEPVTPRVPPTIRQTIPAAVPPAKLPAPAATSELLPGPLDQQIEPAGSTVPSQEPLRLPRYEDSDEDSNAAPSEVQPSPPPIMMRSEWSTFGEETGDEADEGRKIERTSAGKSRKNRDIVLVAGEVSVTGEMEPAPAEIEPAKLEHVPTASKPAYSLGIESWAAIAVTLGVAVLSVLVTGILSREDRHVGSRSATLSDTAAADDQLEPVTAAHEAEEDRRFLQRLIVNQVPLVEEEPRLPEIDHLHGMVIGGRRMIVHEAHEGVPGPHFAVREPNDTRPLERRLRTVLRETATGPRRSEVAMAADSSHVRTSVSPLERALRTVERGGQR